MEIWKDIKGFEGIYQVSNLGRVKSLARCQADKNGRAVNYQGKVLKQTPNSSGYLRVDLKKGGANHLWFVHRLVALHFVENPSPADYGVVNHLDSDFLNNHANNLEWTDLKGNTRHAMSKGRMARTTEWIDRLKKSLEKHSLPVIGCDPLTGQTIRVFKSIQECARNGFGASCVCMCCKGKRKTHKGLAWRYAERNEVVQKWQNL